MFIVIVILVIEKIFQHTMASIAFLFPRSGLEVPDIGDKFVIDNAVMGIANLIISILLLITLNGIVRHQKWSFLFLIYLAGLDIFLEILFHGVGFITISVLVSTILIIFLTLGKKHLQPYRY